MHVNYVRPVLFNVDKITYLFIVYGCCKTDVGPC